MVTEDYVSFNVAKLLKEKGFDEDCWGWYEDEDYTVESNDDYGYQSNTNHISEGFICSRPTHQMAMKWLREEHDILIVIEPRTYDYDSEKTSSYVASLWQGDNYRENITSKYYLTYEEAVEEALKYCLKNLI